MGNASSKDSRGAQGHSHNHGHSNAGSGASPQTLGDGLVSHVYSSRNASGRLSRPDLSFLHIGRDRDGDAPTPERPRETKQDREARRAERERQARLKERERSIREEHVDGGYLVTMGTYTGPEDFSKSIVRQLQIERRLAPFWRGLNDHSDSWTEAQLVAASRGLPIPAADEVPPDPVPSVSQANSLPSTSDASIHGLTIPISSRSQSYQTDASTVLSASHPVSATTSNSNPSSPTTATYSSSPLFRGRAKTLASLAAGYKNQPDLTPQEIRLPNDPNVNGQPLGAVLYKDAEECPICFLYYPPFLNRTRCCDQPICSECFVQIKRPDPHPPEHEQPGQERPPEEEAELLVSEVAACPFCVTPEFGVTFEAPPFRRGLAYANHTAGQPFRSMNSATSSTTSLISGGATRRRATSLSATAPQVITTDRIRPDWAKKLADARAHVLRRSAAATALHNAAYVLGNAGDARSGFTFSRRRRQLIVEEPSSTGSGTPREGDGSGDLFSERSSSRRNRVEDIEELMMMEAIRLSLAAEEERKRKEEKEAAKKAKKDAKEARKEEKRAEKLGKRQGSSGSLYHAGANESSSTWASTSMARSSSNLGAQATILEEHAEGKGKQPVQDFAGFNPLSEPTSTVNKQEQQARQSGSPVKSSSATDDPQRHLEASRANIVQPAGSAPIQTPSRNPHFRQLSNASSAASSFIDSVPGSFRGGEPYTPSMNASGLDVSAGAQQQQDSPAASRSGTPPLVEPMFNFRSLAAMIGEETDKRNGLRGEHVEHADSTSDPPNLAEDEVKEPSPTGSPRIAPLSTVAGADLTTRSRGGSAGSGSGVDAAPATAVATVAVATSPPSTPPPPSQLVPSANNKDFGEVSIVDEGETAG